MKRINLVRLAALAGTCALLASPASAQIETMSWNVAEGSYNVPANWNNPTFGMVQPNFEFDEVALIGNGGLAFVEDTPDPQPGGLTIQGNSTLEIRSGGSLHVQPSPFGGLVTGSAAVNAGNLVGLPGGSFTAESLSSAGGGRIDLSGNTSVTINGATTLAGVTHLAGPEVDFSTGSLENTGTISAQITGAAHSAIQVSGAASLDGTLSVDFGGMMPTIGDTWDIVDAQSITGNFANVTSNISPGPGLVVGSSIVSGGNGQIAQASLQPRLTLAINRRTGQVQIRNLAGVAPTTIDGYFISSVGGTFDPGQWNQFGTDWVPSDAGATHVGELTLTNQREIAATEDIDLGNFFANPARDSEFGVAVEDAAFQYSLESGDVLTGLVEYTDAHNNVVLVVDPENGDTWLQNQSTFDLDIDGYEIESFSGALDPSQWISIASSDAGWTEANPIDVHIGELSLAGTRSLGSESDAITLGSIFRPGSERDLVFRFTTPDFGGQGAMTFTGIVEYEEGPIDFGPGGETVPGDYNNNGTVEQADLDLVLLNWGASFDTLPAEWVNERPASGIVAQAQLDGVLLNWGAMAAQGLVSGGVPEPSGFVLAGLALCLIGIIGTRRRRR